MQKIASGGELSRLALAIKSVGAAFSGTPTMIFDEIDSGLGGRAAQQVADKIAAIAQSKQVLCITHLPQLALVADRHIHLVKEEVDGRTQTRPVRLEEFERVNELARMFYGDAVTPELLSRQPAYWNNISNRIKNKHFSPAFCRSFFQQEETL